MIVACPYCHSTQYWRIGRSDTGTQRYECKICHRKFMEHSKPRAKPIPRQRHGLDVNRPIVNCVHCGKPTNNPKFCSRSCAAVYNNRVSPKRKKEQRRCKRCGRPVTGWIRTCHSCKIEKGIRVDWSKRTLGEVHASAKYQVSALCRLVARQIFKHSNRPRICQNCGYEKHVEICHKRAIKDFPPETPVAVVSGIENLVALCPNCHWEFDNGLLRFDGAVAS